jgi:hypothetical protein
MADKTGQGLLSGISFGKGGGTGKYKYGYGGKRSVSASLKKSLDSTGAGLLQGISLKKEPNFSTIRVLNVFPPFEMGPLIHSQHGETTLMNVVYQRISDQGALDHISQQYQQPPWSTTSLASISLLYHPQLNPPTPKQLSGTE